VRRTLVLLGRPGCHLCEEALERLEPICRSAGFGLRAADVDASDIWRERHGLRIPVLLDGETELGAWPFDWNALATRLVGR